VSSATSSHQVTNESVDVINNVSILGKLVLVMDLELETKLVCLSRAEVGGAKGRLIVRIN